MTKAEEDRLKLDFIDRLQRGGADTTTSDRATPKAKRKAGDRETRGTPDYSKGYESVGLSVHSSQAKEMQAMADSAGLTGIKFDSAGRCTVTDRKHRRDFLKLRGMRDNDGGYGD